MQVSNLSSINSTNVGNIQRVSQNKNPGFKAAACFASTASQEFLDRVAKSTTASTDMTKFIEGLLTLIKGNWLKSIKHSDLIIGVKTDALNSLSDANIEATDFAFGILRWVPEYVSKPNASLTDLTPTITQCYLSNTGDALTIDKTRDLTNGEIIDQNTQNMVKYFSSLDEAITGMQEHEYFAKDKQEEANKALNHHLHHLEIGQELMKKLTP